MTDPPPTRHLHFRTEIPDADRAARMAGDVRRRVGEFLQNLDATADERQAAELAVEELLTNLGKFGRPGPDAPPVDAELSVELDERVLRLDLRDTGPPFDPTRPPAPDLDAPLEERSIGGLGLFMLSQLFPQREYRREDGRNRSVWRRPRG